jgi:hypothetical protein
MAAASDFLENKLLDHVLTTTGYTQPSTRYLALFTADTGLETNSPSAEISASGTAYARKTVTFGAASSGTSATNATVTFDTATASWGLVSDIAIMDAETSGNVLFYGELTTAKQIDAADTMQVTSGNLTVSLA